VCLIVVSFCIGILFCLLYVMFRLVFVFLAATSFVDIFMYAYFGKSIFFKRIFFKFYVVKPVLNGISRVQNIFPLKSGFRLIQVYYDRHAT
jgi:hypothetical protein